MNGFCCCCFEVMNGHRSNTATSEWDGTTLWCVESTRGDAGDVERSSFVVMQCSGAA